MNGIISSSASIGCLALVCWVINRRWRLLRRRKESPQDYAYFLHERFGPTLRLPPVKRIRRGLPHVAEATIMGWIRDFEKVGQSIYSLAEQGGTEGLTRAVVQAKLQSEFPFLKHEGLIQALFLVDYMAWHEGYLSENKKPNQSPESIPLKRHGSS